MVDSTVDNSGQKCINKQVGADLYGPAPLYTYTLYTIHYTLYTIHLYTYTLIHYTLIYTYTYISV